MEVIQFLSKKIDSDIIVLLINLIYIPLFWVLTYYLFYKIIIKKGYSCLKERILLKKLAKSGIHEIDRMDGLQFEVYLKALLKEIGYKSEVTSGSHDFGADLIMKKDGKKVVIQAKRYGYKNKVSLGAVQEIYAAKPFYKANECWVFTNSHYTKSAQKLAKACGVKLYDRFKLIAFINQINPSVQAKEVMRTVDPAPRKCPKCSAELIKRTNKNQNHFMGCSNYPRCTHTEKIAN